MKDKELLISTPPPLNLLALSGQPQTIHSRREVQWIPKPFRFFRAGVLNQEYTAST